MCLRRTGLWGTETERCYKEYMNDTLTGSCPPVWDKFVCWPPTTSGNTSFQPCPRMKGYDMSKFVFRDCLKNGTWARHLGGDGENPTGWTNYSACFNPFVKDFIRTVHGSQSHLWNIDNQMKNGIAEANRTLEMVGLTLSIVSLATSLIIFNGFRNLKNDRTQILKNLFTAVSIQVIVRLILNIDPYLGKIFNTEFYTVQTTEYTCEAAYVFLEYARATTFFWMFVEGLYLHNTMMAVVNFQERWNFGIYYIIGWGIPILLVLIWGHLTYNKFHSYVCWWGYTLSGLFWVLEGPRLLVFVLNLVLLLNVTRVLMTKLRESNSTETLQLRKAVRAAIVLVPLLGITNRIEIIHSPLGRDVIVLANWSYITTILTSFQGFFCALIYCFLNGKVQRSVRHCLKARKHGTAINRRNCLNPDGDGLSDVMQSHIVEKTEQMVGSFKDANASQTYQRPTNSTLMEIEKHHLSASEKRKVKAVCGTPDKKVDPFHEHWSDAELSSHNHVDIEQIEIPFEYFTDQRKTTHDVNASANDQKILTTSQELKVTSRILNQDSIDSFASSADSDADGHGEGQGQVRIMLAKIDISRPTVHNGHQVE